MVPDTDDPRRFAAGSVLTGDSGRSLRIETVKPYRDRGLIIAFEGVTDRAAAEELRGTLLTITRADRRRLDEDEFWPDQLVGLEARSRGGDVLGTVTAVDLGAAQDRLIVTTAEGVEVLVPFVGDLVDDPADGIVVIDAPAGLFPDRPDQDA